MLDAHSLEAHEFIESRSMHELQYKDKSPWHRLREHARLTGISRQTLITLILLGCMVLGFVIYTSFLLIKPLNPTRTELYQAGSESLQTQSADTSKASKSGTDQAENIATGADPQAFEQLAVHVAGEVVNPGVYYLSATSRIQDALTSAGGPTENADPHLLNLAEQVSDGMHIVVPPQGGAVDQVHVSSGRAGSGVSSGSGAPSGEQTININKANVEELTALPGVGPATAQKIIDERTQNGPFRSVDDLDRVSGLGSKKIEKLKSKARV